MTYYRRKLLLALIERFTGSVGKIELQKLLFLLCKLQESPSYNFIPYKYGCYSYQAVWDLETLKKYGFVVKEGDKWNIIRYDNYFQQLKSKDKGALNLIYNQFKNSSLSDLVKKTYIDYPYWAINSKMLDNLLNEDEILLVKHHRPTKSKKSLYTIGYEGISIEEYFNKLIINDVKVLCDVRRNAFSQKIGFSKNILKKICEELQIIYVHIPELGIPAEKRQNLETQKDYDVLFDEYEKEYLIFQQGSVNRIYEMIQQHNRVALTCFEASFCQCHRSKVAGAVMAIDGWNYELFHI